MAGYNLFEQVAKQQFDKAARKRIAFDQADGYDAESLLDADGVDYYAMEEDVDAAPYVPNAATELYLGKRSVLAESSADAPAAAEIPLHGDMSSKVGATAAPSEDTDALYGDMGAGESAIVTSAAPQQLETTEAPHKPQQGKTLFLDCPMGIAGDMFVAALLDLAGSDGRRALSAALGSLKLKGFTTKISRVRKSGIDCCDFNVIVDEAHDGHDHDMTYLHGSASAHGGTGPGTGDASSLHAHEHRGLTEIFSIIEAAKMAPAAKAFAHKVFRILAEAEAKAHRVPINKVHFHEVGAVDSIVDIVAAAVLVDHLGIEKTIVPVLVDGQGTVRCQHGVIPVPVPATVNVCAAHGLPLSRSSIQGELVTPTGAALVAALNPGFELPERYVVQAVGLGAGKRKYKRPSMVRAVMIEGLPGSSAKPQSFESAWDVAGPAASLSNETCPPGTTTKLECEIDDCSPEVLAYAAESLRSAGAREVHWVPVYSKKGRPAWQLQVICSNDDVERMQNIIFAETTTLGIRSQRMERTFLPRRLQQVRTVWGTVRVKIATLPDGTERVSAEYEDCAKCAQDAGVPLQQVMAEAVRLGQQSL